MAKTFEKPTKATVKEFDVTKTDQLIVLVNKSKYD
jgi:hypothetical protein